jgi:ornithine cyclodeaminase/alanine dehydrogenase-like protein (mu-crystallin family)
MAVNANLYASFIFIQEMTMPNPLLLTRSEIRQVAAWPVLLQAVRAALLLREENQAATPVSGQITMPNALLHLKGGAVFEPGALSVKANIRPHGGNANGAVLLFDTKAGRISAILDSADITAMRTAALASLAAQSLARPGPASLAILGAGPVAAQVAAALPLFLPLTRLHVWSRSSVRAQLLAECAALPAEVHASPEEAARNADIVVTATPARASFLEAGGLRDGALVLALGADSPGKRELGSSVLAEATIVADQREDVLKVGESSYLPPAETHRVRAELGAILAGKSPAPAATGADSRFLVFDSVGSATVDTTVCAAIVALATEQGLGTAFDFSR